MQRQPSTPSPQPSLRPQGLKVKTHIKAGSIIVHDYMPKLDGSSKDA